MTRRSATYRLVESPSPSKARIPRRTTSLQRTPSFSFSLDENEDDDLENNFINELDPLRNPNDIHTDDSDSDSGVETGAKEKKRKYAGFLRPILPKAKKSDTSLDSTFDSDDAYFRYLRPPSRLLALIPPHLLTRRNCMVFLVATITLILFGLGVGKYASEFNDPYTMWEPSGEDGRSPAWYPTPQGGTYNRWAESYKKAASLVSKMTLVEKVNVTTGTGWQMGMCVGNTGPVSRLGFPSLCLQDGPLGLRFVDNVTASPAGITVGATWNRELAYKRGRMMGIEARMKGVNAILGPSIGPLGRVPGGGRNWEAFGIDPVLQSVGAVETINGIQDEGVMATIKHFVGNEQEHFRQANEWNTPNAISSNIDDRTLHEIYAWPFAEAIRAGVVSLMCSYNQVNNSYACQNSKLINGILKDEMGFQGFVQSDWLAQRGGVAAALAGLDMSMPGDGELWADGRPYWGPELTSAVLNGSVPVARLDDMVLRIVAAWYQVGQDDSKKWPLPPPDGDGGPNFSSWTNEEYGLTHQGSDDKTQGKVNYFIDPTRDSGFSHSGLARRIAAEGTILLKNENDLLPIDRDGVSLSKKPENENAATTAQPQRSRIAIVGEDAVLPQGGPNVCPDHGCNEGTLAMGWGSGTADFPYLVAPWDALAKRMSGHADLMLLATNDRKETDSDASLPDSDLCFVFVNADSGEGFIKSGGIDADRPDLSLQKGGDALIESVSSRCGQRTKTGSKGKTIVVIHSVGPVLLESFIDSKDVGAVLYANLPGQESGNALADIVFGLVNPSGRLPYTIARKASDYGPSGQIMLDPNGGFPQQNFSEGVLVDYRWFDAKRITPRFEFGYGMSYSSFELSGLSVKTLEERPQPVAPPRRPELPPTKLPNSTTPNARDAEFPRGFRRLKKYIYPYIDSASSIRPDNPHYPIPMEDLPTFSPSDAGGGEGGNPALWDAVARVTVDVTNMGARSGQTVVQLYVKFPDINEVEQVDEGLVERTSRRIGTPPRVLRAFQKVHLRGSVSDTGDGEKFKTGEKKTLEFQVSRRDLSYWSTKQQNWVMPSFGSWGIEVGFSSRDLPVSAWLF